MTRIIASLTFALAVVVGSSAASAEEPSKPTLSVKQRAQIECLAGWRQKKAEGQKGLEAYMIHMAECRAAKSKAPTPEPEN